MSRNARYRGRNQGRRWVKLVITLLVVFLVLGGIGYFFVQNYLVYGPDGSVSIDIPWLNNWREEASPSPSPIQIIIDSFPPDEGSPAPASEDVSPAPEPIQAGHALYLPLDLLTDEAALDTLLQIGADTKVDTFVLECKADDGRLAWVSVSPLAQGAGLNAAEDLIGPAVKKIHDAGFSVTARISCFRDKIMPDKQQTIGVKHNVGLNWVENTDSKQRWLDPYKDEAVNYLCSLLTDLADMELDEILLDNVQFPTTGSISYIDYGPAGNTPRYQAIEAFLQRVKNIVEPSGIALSAVLLPETVTTGASLDGGQRLSVFSETFTRLCVPADAETLDSVREGMRSALGPDDEAVRFVPMFTIPNNAAPALLETTVGLIPDGGWMLINAEGQYARLWP